ncbi:MAG: hypothetical protein QXT50_00400 [Thermofilum sp.]
MGKDSKAKVVEALKMKGIDVFGLERELMMMLRRGMTSIEVYEFLKKLIEGEKR